MLPIVLNQTAIQVGLAGAGEALARRRKTLAVEPMTCPPNAFATGQDLLVLQPGETVTHAWGIQASS